MVLRDANGQVQSIKAGKSIPMKGGGTPAITGASIKTDSGMVNLGVETPSDNTLKEQQIQLNKQKLAESKGNKLKQLSDNINDLFYELDKIPGGTGVTGRITGLGSKVGGFTQADPKTASYGRFLTAIRPQLSRGLGDVGNFNLQEQIAAMELPGNPGDNIETRVAMADKFLNYMAIRGIPTEHMTYAKNYIKKYTGKDWTPPNPDEMIEAKKQSAKVPTHTAVDDQNKPIVSYDGGKTWEYQ